ncbi:hypothetical protein LCGC14_2689450 [marine sediment metagenome]|uniref:Siphovirus Gp157 family protein n=1 Tax=marine sediment metagenome TaxID=412755 RepID=A0A0F8ZIY8_9ZZZZ
MKLYEISNDYIELLQAADADESIRDALDDTLEVLGSDFDQKAVNVAKYILNVQAESEAIKKAEQSMKDRRLTLDKKVLWLKRYVREQMEKLEKSKVWCPEFELKIKRNPPSLVIRDEDLVPKRFKQIVKVVSIDKGSIKEFMKSGDVPGCSLEHSNRLEIK